MALCKGMVQKEYNRKLFCKVGVLLLYFVLHSSSKEDSSVTVYSLALQKVKWNICRLLHIQHSIGRGFKLKSYVDQMNNFEN